MKDLKSLIPHPQWVMFWSSEQEDASAFQDHPAQLNALPVDVNCQLLGYDEKQGRVGGLHVRTPHQW